MILNRCLKGMEYLHATLFFAMFIPLFYAAAGWSDPAGTGVLYFRCLLVAVPVVVTERAAKTVRSVILYAVICMLLLSGVGGIAVLTAGLADGQGICYCIGIVAETFFIAVKRFVDRVRAARLKREEPLAGSVASFLDHPSRALVWYFVVFYLIGLCLSAKLLCDIAFGSAIVYTFLVIFYEYFGATKAYLEMNRRTRGIPRRRLYGVSFSMLLIFAALLLAGMMPAIFMAGQRQYIDIRELLADVKLVPYEYERDAGFQQPMPGGADWMELLNDGEPAPEPSRVINVIFGVIGTVCVLFFLYGLVQVIRQVLRDFRNSRDENGDIIEEIDEDQISGQREDLFHRKRGRGAESEAQRIRRRYRRTIRQHRKERPAPYESPAEIEECAGLKNDEEMQQLHKKYEEVRYGKGYER